jgi:putative spermidine/putrescine transport system substrate-binding protein
LAAAESLTVVSFGGQYAVSQIEAYHKPYTAETGIVVNSVDYNGGLAELRAQVESGNVTWDVLDVETQDLELGCSEGLFERLDLDSLPAGLDGTPARDDFVPGTLHECGVGAIIWSNIIAYNATAFPDRKPAKIADFFDIENFPGKRGISRRPNCTLEWALIADGVPASDVYDVLSTPEGVDRAFAKLDTIKDHIIVYEAGAQPPQLLADGEVTMSSAFNGRIYSAMIDENQPLNIIWNAQIWNVDYFAIPTGANTEAAYDFIKFATGTKPLAEQSKYISYAPVRKSSLPLIDEALVPHLATGQPDFDSSLQFNAQWWADHADEINERFSVWLAK